MSAASTSAGRGPRPGTGELSVREALVRVWGRARGPLGWAGVLTLTVWSAVAAKRAGVRPPPLVEAELAGPGLVLAVGAPMDFEALERWSGRHLDPETARLAADPTVRWFDGRPVRPARDVTMIVTAYSPDERSCGTSADGITATLHSVTTNGHALVAADPKVLPYGSMLTIPGYDGGRIVPVLDCGGAIKGMRLDVLYPTHEAARTWGRQKLRVTVWEYADGLPSQSPRRLR